MQMEHKNCLESIFFTYGQFESSLIINLFHYIYTFFTLILFWASCLDWHFSQWYFWSAQRVSVLLNTLRQWEIEVLASTSTDKSKKSSSLDETVSQFKHLVSLVNVPWNSSWIHVVVDDVDDDDEGEVDDADEGDNNDDDGDVVVVVVDEDDEWEYGSDDDEQSDGIVSAAEVAPDFFKLLLLGAVCGRRRRCWDVGVFDADADVGAAVAAAEEWRPSARLSDVDEE